MAHGRNVYNSFHVDHTTFQIWSKFSAYCRLLLSCFFKAFYSVLIRFPFLSLCTFLRCVSFLKVNGSKQLAGCVNALQDHLRHNCHRTFFRIFPIPRSFSSSRLRCLPDSVFHPSAWGNIKAHAINPTLRRGNVPPFSVYSCASSGDLQWSPSLLKGAAHEFCFYNSFHDLHRLSFSFVSIV